MDWENKYQTNDTPWDKGEAHPSLRMLLPGGAPDGAILVPGCGTGHDVHAIAQHWPTCEVFGVDIAPSAVAAATIRCAFLANARILTCDFLNASAPLPSAGFALVWEHTFFCALHPSLRSDYAQACARLIKQGGELRGVFFLKMDNPHSGPPWNCPEEEFVELFSEHFEIEILGPTPHTFLGRESEEYGVRMKRKIG